MVTTRSKTKSASLIGVMPGTLYVKIWAVMMIGYAAQMLLIPANMVTDHWDMPSTPGMEFWIRGHAASVFTVVYLLSQVPADIGVKAGMALSIAIGILYLAMITVLDARGPMLPPPPEALAGVEASDQGGAAAVPPPAASPSQESS